MIASTKKYGKTEVIRRSECEGGSRMSCLRQEILQAWNYSLNDVFCMDFARKYNWMILKICTFCVGLATFNGVRCDAWNAQNESYANYRCAWIALWFQIIVRCSTLFLGWLSLFPISKSFSFAIIFLQCKTFHSAISSQAFDS